MPDVPTTIDFFYIKSNSFQNHHADGAIASPTVTGGVTVSFYAERAAIPQRVTHEIKDGKLGPEIGREGKVGLIRDLECTVIMNKEIAIALRDLLTRLLEPTAPTKEET